MPLWCWLCLFESVCSAKATPGEVVQQQLLKSNSQPRLGTCCLKRNHRRNPCAGATAPRVRRGDKAGNTSDHPRWMSSLSSAGQRQGRAGTGSSLCMRGAEDVSSRCQRLQGLFQSGSILPTAWHTSLQQPCTLRMH